ncbi:MAG: leucine-rich repeat domain-containing protein [Candidatus Cohnella colombiensis]|uniref:Leucine-rich repeat domain-containing protein n=1 Tax=Candidatus Cohnella colombiensis TaxID=3121368 RepID=A0AA95JDI8_9BACL|nr:MAG: leucine-rich repeat domain-containing protein [Cohnella sp.]
MGMKRMKKLGLCTIVATLILLNGHFTPKGYAADDSNEIVVFPDANLKQALISIGVDTNGDGEITRGEMAARSDPHGMANGLSSLALGNKNISNLTGLEYAVNIASLALSGNNITDLTPISNLSKLTSVDVGNNPIRDLSPLAKLNTIRFMVADNDKNLDLSTIMSMTNLEYLYLDQSNISDISPLANLKKLKVLHMFNNQISDISPLSSLSDLREVAIRSNQIKNVNAFANKPYLDTLWLSDNMINDVSGLKNVPNLKSLELDYNQISDISSFSSLVNLKDTLLDYNQITDISPLANIKNIEKLGIYDNRISNINALAGLTKITHLYIGKNQIQDISPLANLNAMKELLIASNPIKDISSLKNMSNLLILGASDAQISDISVLAGLTKLQQLGLDKNTISNITPLKGLVNLNLLSINDNPFSDASPILALTNLTRLYLENDKKATISPVVSGVKSGEFYNTDRVITFNRGTAQLNNKAFASGTTVSQEGFYQLFVQDFAGINTTINFAIDKTPPIVTGVTNGATYDKDVTISFNEGKATLNNKPIGNGAKVDADGDYTLVVIDEANNRTTIQFKYNGGGPVVRGVSSGGYYNTDKVITFDQGTATLDGKPFISGGKVTEDGVHTLVVTGKAGKITKIVFTINKGKGGETSGEGQQTNVGQGADISKLRGVSNWAKPDLQYASTIGLIKPVESSVFTSNVTREQFSEIAVKLYEAISGNKVKAPATNPFKDTSNTEILKAYQLGIVKGTSAQQFSPQAFITREQLATMLMRVMEQAGQKIPNGSPKKFADRSTFSAYAVEAIDFMSSIEVIKGITSTTFGPK